MREQLKSLTGAGDHATEENVLETAGPKPWEARALRQAVLHEHIRDSRPSTA